MHSQKNIEFSNRKGQVLSGKLGLPGAMKPRAYAIFAHCFTCGKNIGAARAISRSLNQEGFAVLRFDFTGLGESEGEFSDTNFSSNVEDLLDAIKFLSNSYEAPKLLVGHSLGGAAVLKAAILDENIEAVVTIGAPSEPQHVKHLFDSDISNIETDGETVVNIGSRPFKIKQQFIQDIEKQRLLDQLPSMRKALLIMHSPQDIIVGISNAAELYTHAHHPKSFISLNGADHLLSNKKDAEYVGKVLASWAERYLETQSEIEVIESPGVIARLSEESGLTTEIWAGKHGLIADEPEELGGANLGPSPYEYLSSGLAACTAMTLNLYAKRKSWPLENVEVQVEYSKKHLEDCKDCENPGAKLDHFHRSIRLEGDLSRAQIDRLLEIADKCPVHKTLSSEIHINTKEIKS